MRSSNDRLLEVPDADAAEQSRELRPPVTGEGRPVEVEAPSGAVSAASAEADEFDAVEQRFVVDQDDEEEYR